MRETSRVSESNTTDSADTNPLPQVSSARAWTSISFPKAAPVIREKATAPTVPHRLRADGTQEIRAEDILVIVPRMPSSEELDDADIVVEEAAPEFRPPAYSIHATQEILADDVIEVTAAAVREAPVESHRDEIPSTLPWTVDAPDDLEFPTPPQYSGPYPAAPRPRITNFSATQVFRRRSVNLAVVVVSMTLAAGVVLISGIARFAQGTTTADGPIGISAHAPKALDTSVRPGTLAYGTAPHVRETVAVSIDALPAVPQRHVWHRRR